MIRRRRGVRVTAVVLLTTAVAAACGGTGPSAPDAAAGPSRPAFTQADVEFVVHLSQHHGQALHMAELAAARGRSTTVKQIAAEIAAAYAPDIDVLAGWLQAWGEAGAELPGHGIEGEAGPGMLSERAVGRLEAVRGSAFDREFRVLMTRHHRGGLALVAEQLAAGINPDARALAERLRAEQTAQLADLK